MQNGNKNTVAIIDYKMGNLFSVEQACIHVGLEPIITSDKSVLMTCDAAILPGVGAFGEAIKSLQYLDLISPIKDFIDSGKPFLGICLGYQLLFSESEEFGHNKGLDIFPGVVRKFTGEKAEGGKNKVPQIGWNNLIMDSEFVAGKKSQSPLRDTENHEFMYFVHSYYVKTTDEEIIATTTNYSGIDYCSSIYSANVFASQFHPEKSGKEGIKIYKNWSKQLELN